MVWWETRVSSTIDKRSGGSTVGNNTGESVVDVSSKAETTQRSQKGQWRSWPSHMQCRPMNACFLIGGGVDTSANRERGKAKLIEAREEALLTFFLKSSGSFSSNVIDEFGRTLVKSNVAVPKCHRNLADARRHEHGTMRPSTDRIVSSSSF